LYATRKGNAIIIDFNDRLATGNKQALTGFELINEKGERIAADATISKNNVWLKVPPGTAIKSIFYAMQPYTHANLVNTRGLPASTFVLKQHSDNKFY